MVKLQTSSTDIFRSVGWNVDWVQYMYVLSLHQLFVHYLVSQCSHVASLHVVFTVLWLNSHMLNLTLACRSYLILGRWLSILQYKTVQFSSFVTSYCLVMYSIPNNAFAKCWNAMHKKRVKIPLRIFLFLNIIHWALAI